MGPRTRKLLGILIGLALVPVLLAEMMTAAYADVTVSYLDSNGVKHDVSCIEVTESSTFGSDGWYVVNSSRVRTAPINVYDKEIHLILCDGCTLNASSIYISQSGSLTYMPEVQQERSPAMES